MTVISQGLPSCGLALVRAPRHLGEGHYVSLRPHDLTGLDSDVSAPLSPPKSMAMPSLSGAGAGASSAPRPGSQLAPCLTAGTVSIPFTVWLPVFLVSPGGSHRPTLKTTHPGAVS